MIEMAVVRKQCPGDGVRGCLTTIPSTRTRCRFCARTIALRG